MAAGAVLALSCGTKESQTMSHSLAADPPALSFESAGNKPQTITVTAVNVEWRVEVEDTAKGWLRADKTGGDNVTATVSDNTEESGRTGSVPIRSAVPPDAEPVVVNVSQKADDKPAGSISLTPDTLSFDWHGTPARQVTVTTVREGFTWEASVDVTSIGWLHVSAEGNTISVTADDNEYSAERTGTINVKPSDPNIAGATITVTQKACGMQPIFLGRQNGNSFQSHRPTAADDPVGVRCREGLADGAGVQRL